MLYSNKTDLTLRKIEKSDLPLLLEYKKESWIYTHRISVLNSMDQENWFNKITSSSTTLVMIAESIYPIEPVKESEIYGKRIGLYILDNMDWQNGTYDMSYGVFRHCRGNKFGSKLLKIGIDFSFDVMNFRRIDCEVLANNVSSLHCVTNAGFKLEGVRKEAINRCGEKIDSHIFGLIKG